MNERRFTFGLWCALAVAMIAACGEAPKGERGGPLGRGIYVPITWKAARIVEGHHTHVIGRAVPCVKCHELSADSIGKVTPARCAACHEKEGRIAHAAAHARERFGGGASADCTSCHAFRSPDGADAGAPPPETDSGVLPTFAAADCGRCHREKQGETPAVTVHGTSECTKCHRPHEDDRPKPGACTACHEMTATGHGKSSGTAIEECTTCHRHQHAPAAEARSTCVGCHLQKQPIVPVTALFPEGHRECIGCHRPHSFGRDRVEPCRSCHADQRVLGASHVKEHAACTSCHAPHDVRGSARAACVRCHTGVHPDHPDQARAGACVGCHAPHPSGALAHAPARACSSCHQVAKSDTDFHGGLVCTKCHTPHAFRLASRGTELCRGCHQKQVALASTRSGHQDCQNCHRGLPHRPTALGAACGTCHAAIQAVARQGHSKCTGCHEPHGGKVSTACSNCHADEARTAPQGHRVCTNCHEQHGGAPTKAPCASCHKAEAASAHGGLATGCTTCHRPHGPAGPVKPPPCATCHEKATLPGLHQKAAHADCATCHQGHADPKTVAPAVCRSCHTAQKDHFPDAPFCGSCHLFTKTR